MSKQTISIHRALSELKTYEERISRVMQGTFVIANKRSNDKIQGKTINEIKNSIKGNFDSFKSLSENMKRIKSAVVLSNAKTVVKIAGVNYSVAEAIERKAKIKFDEMFLQTLKFQFAQQNSKVEKENEMLPSKLETFLQSILGEKDKRTVEDIEAHTRSFENRNKFELIDPSGILSQIEKLEKEIMDFKNEVDYVLSESNSTTFIEVEFVD